MRAQHKMLMLLDQLTQNPLFKDIPPDDISGILHCAGAQTTHYDKGDILLHESAETSNIGILLSGCAQAYKLDASGRRLLIARLFSGSLFGDVLTSARRKSPVSIIALEDITALYISYDAVLHRCHMTCPRHDLLLKNLLAIISEKYLDLNDRINCIIRPTLREKIMFYLGEIGKSSTGGVFNIPFTRAELADYLNADRSAVSRELAAMKQDGIIDYYKNTFKINN